MPKPAKTASPSNETARPSRRFLATKALEKLLPQNLPARADVIKALEAVRIPTPKLVPAGASRAAEILRINSWLLTFVSADSPHELLSSLDRLAGTWNSQLHEVRSLSDAPDFSTVYGSSDPLPQTERLRAMLARVEN